MRFAPAKGIVTCSCLSESRAGHQPANGKRQDAVNWPGPLGRGSAGRPDELFYSFGLAVSHVGVKNRGRPGMGWQAGHRLLGRIRVQPSENRQITETRQIATIEKPPRVRWQGIYERRKPNGTWGGRLT